MGVTAVVGAGPVGLVLALGLAVRGERVLLLDPDPGPAADGGWRRTGVMQFRHPHFFRHQVRMMLEEHVPSMWAAVVAAGCVVNGPPPGLPPHVTSVAARRSTFEGALRRAAVHERLTHGPVRADRIVVRAGRVTAVAAGGRRYDCDRVVVATGRRSRFADDLRPPAEGGPCGQSYVSRMYRARPGVEPLVSWAPPGALYDGYQAIAFPQDAGTLSALVVRPSGDPEWSLLRDDACFERAVAQIPCLAPWTDPARFEPLTPVMRGGTLVNAYRGQGDPPAGVFFVGDAVCTTNPSAGRGVTLGLQQAGALLRLLDEHADPRDACAAFDDWCTAQVRPWFEDHLHGDASILRTYGGDERDVEGPLPSNVIAAAVEADPSLAGPVLAYQGMVALPASLGALEPTVRALLREGWRPRPDAGPSGDELLDRVRRARPDRAAALPAPAS